MKQNLLLSILCIGLLFGYSSCSDSDDDKTSDNGGITNAKDFIEKKKDEAKQEVTFNTSELPKTFTFKEGVEINVRPGTFTKDGAAVEGNITLEVYEMLKPSSIIFSGTNTNYQDYGGGSYFETDGFIYVNAKQNGQSLDAHLAKNLIISIPTDKEDGTLTQLWTGNEEARADIDSNEGDPQFAWNNMGELDIVWNDSIVQGNGDGFNNTWSNNGVFGFSFGKLGWMNCDIFWGQDKEMTTLTVDLTGEFGKLASYMAYEGDTFVFFCAKGVPVLAQIYTPVDENTVVTYENAIPVGAEGKLIAFSIREGKISFASQDITITKDMKVTLNLEIVSKTDLENKIKAIDGYSK